MLYASLLFFHSPPLHFSSFTPNRSGSPFTVSYTLTPLSLFIYRWFQDHAATFPLSLSFSLSHVTCWHHSLPLSLSKSWQHRSFLPLSHDKTKGGNQMTNFSPFTWFLSLSTERKLCPPNPSSSPEVCPVLSIQEKYFGLDGILGARGKMWVILGLNRPSEISSLWV